jgi:hypothetical protein
MKKGLVPGGCRRRSRQKRASSPTSHGPPRAAPHRSGLIRRLCFSTSPPLYLRSFKVGNPIDFPLASWCWGTPELLHCRPCPNRTDRTVCSRCSDWRSAWWCAGEVEAGRERESLEEVMREAAVLRNELRVVAGVQQVQARQAAFQADPARGTRPWPARYAPPSPRYRNPVAP